MLPNKTKVFVLDIHNLDIRGVTVEPDTTDWVVDDDGSLVCRETDWSRTYTKEEDALNAAVAIAKADLKSASSRLSFMHSRYIDQLDRLTEFIKRGRN